jgi:hypothetical protein
MPMRLRYPIVSGTCGFLFSERAAKIPGCGRRHKARALCDGALRIDVHQRLELPKPPTARNGASRSARFSIRL